MFKDLQLENELPISIESLGTQLGTCNYGVQKRFTQVRVNDGLPKIHYQHANVECDPVADRCCGVYGNEPGG